MNRSVIPSLQKQKAMCRRFFDVISQTYKKQRLGHKPERVYTLSEMRINVFLDATILMCASADGTQIPPFVIFRGQRLKLTSARDAYPEAFFTCSYDGRVNDVVLLWWFRDHFLKKIPASNHRPCVLYLSRSVGDVTFQLAQLAREERIHIVSIPPGIQHLLQPLDVNLASKIENAIIKKAKKWEDENAATPFTQKVLAQILQKVWRKGIDSVDITTNFAANGVFPCNSLAISNDRIIAACQALKEQQKSPSPSLMVRNNQFSGLSLLSALSSHEYASLENIYPNNDSPTKAAQLVEVEEAYEPEEDVEQVRYGKRKRGERHAERERHKRQVTQEIEKIIEEAKVRSTDHTEKSVLATLMEESPKKEGRRSSHHAEEEQPTLTQELLGAKENFEQINRAIESIGGSIEQESDAVGMAQRVVTVSAPAESIVEEVVEEDVGLIRVYDQDGNEVMVEEVTDVMSEEVVGEEIKMEHHQHLHHQEEVVHEEIIHEEQLSLQHQEVEHEQSISMEQIITTQSPDQEVIMQNFADSQVSLGTDQPQYITINDPNVAIDQHAYTETIVTDQMQFLEQDPQPQQYQLFSEEDAHTMLLQQHQQQQHHQQQQQQQELPTVVATTRTTKSRGKDGPKVRIIRPQIQVVKVPKPAQPAPRIIKILQAPGSNSMQLNMEQLQQILQLSNNSQVMTMGQGSQDNIVMLPEDCVQEVVLE